MQLIFEQIRVGGDRNFGYLLGDRDARVGVLIDPSYAPELLVERARAQGLAITHILNTHGHADHINGNTQAQALTQALVAAHADSPALPDVVLKEGERLRVGGLALEFLFTPGHCPDHFVIHEPQHQLLITGDLLFVGKVGGTHSDADATTEWASLQRVLQLPGETTVWPGHDYGVRPASTLALERATNPFLRCADLAAFLKLKANWAVFKQAQGLK